MTPDESGSIKFIHRAIFLKKDVLDWDDFNAIFCKGFFRHAVIACARSLNTKENQNLSMMLKISKQKRGIMMGQVVTEGKALTDRSGAIKRPVIESLKKFKLGGKPVP